MATRAERNNNPGNLRPGVGRIVFTAQTGTDKDGFAVFATRDAGVAAADANLLSYAKGGVVTVKGIISKWAPATENNTSGYIDKVASDIGVTSTEALNMSDPLTRSKLLTAIFKVEGNSDTNADVKAFDGVKDLYAAVSAGKPVTFDMLQKVFTSPATAAGNVAQGAAGAVTDAIGNVANFDVGDWITKNLGEQLWQALKDKVIPIGVGLIAALLVAFSVWGMVKDTPAGSAVKAGASFVPGGRLFL